MFYGSKYVVISTVGKMLFDTMYLKYAKSYAEEYYERNHRPTYIYKIIQNNRIS